MKTLVIISHPDLINSASQQYFLSSLKGNNDVTIHHLEATYPNGEIDVKAEQQLLKQHDRIIFQFPFYWYSSPALLKQWQDVVLESGFAYGKRGTALHGKEFGLVLMIGVHEREYQAGGTEQFSINELTKPFQAMANKVGMTYIKALPIFQFGYMEEEEKMDILIKYWQMLTMESNLSLAAREQWLISQLENWIEQVNDSQESGVFTYAIELIQENRMTIDGLQMIFDDMYE